MQQRRIDSILTPYVQETDPFERERLLEEIISGQAIPVVRRVLRQQLGFRVSLPGREANNSEADDLLHEIVARIIERLRSLHTLEPHGSQGVITDFISYVSRVARNLCYDYLRGKYPLRHLLKSRVRYLLGRNPAFRLWKDDQSTIICGLAEWHGQPVRKEKVGDEQLIELIKSRYQIKQRRSSELLLRVVSDIFIETGTPLVIDRLVTLVTRVVESNEMVIDSLDSEHDQLQVTLPDQRPLVDQNLVDRERLKRLWNEILKLPLLQRKVVLLSTIDGVQEDLWSIFLESETVTRANILEALAISEEEFQRLWSGIPLDVAGLANYLGIGRDQVIRSKYYARQRLKKGLANFRRGEK